MHIIETVCMAWMHNSLLGGRYRLVRQLGQGGMATVLEAVDEQQQRVVAVKLLRGTGQASDVARFRREAEAVARLEHPNIVAMLDFGFDGDAYYCVMEYVAGWSLATVLTQLRTGSALPADSTAETAVLAPRPAAASIADDSSPIKPGPIARAGPPHARTRTYIHEMCRIARDAALGLAHAHGRGVIHRDVKPENLLLDHAGRVRVTDFGLASVAGEQVVTIAGELLGTPRYMSPEQVAAGRVPVDARTDVYSLGTTLYEMLALVPPHVHATREGLLRAIAVKEPPALRACNPGVDRGLAAVVQRAIEKDPDRRYGTMAEFATDLERYLTGRRVLARPVGPLPRLWRRQHRSVRFGSVAVVAVALLGLVYGALTRQPSALPGLTAAQRAALLVRARTASMRGDWEHALLRFAQALPAEPRRLITLEMQYALARVPAVRFRLPYVGPGPRMALRLDGDWLVACHQPQAALLVRPEAPQCLPVELHHRSDDVVQSARVLEDERVFTVGRQEVVIWNTSGERIGVFEAPVRHCIRAAEADARGEWLAAQLEPSDPDVSSSRSRTLMLLHLDERSHAFQPTVKAESVLDGAIAPDGSLAASVSTDGELTVTVLADEPRWQNAAVPTADRPLCRVWCLGNGTLIALDAGGGWHAGQIGVHAANEVSWYAPYTAPGAWSAADAGLAIAARCGEVRIVTATPIHTGNAQVRCAVQLHRADVFTPVGPVRVVDEALVGGGWPMVILRIGTNVEVCDAADGERLQILATPDPPETPTASAPADLALPPVGGNVRLGLPEICSDCAAVGAVCGLSADVRGRRVLLVTPRNGEGPRTGCLWDTASGLLLASWSTSDDALLSVRLAPSGESLLCTYADAHLLWRDFGAAVAGVTREPAPAQTSDRAEIDDEGRVRVHGPQGIARTLWSRAGAISAFARTAPVDPALWPRSYGIGGTRNGTITLFDDNSEGTPIVEIPTRLGSIVAVTNTGDMVAALDEDGQAALLYLATIGLPRTGKPVPAIPSESVAVFDLSAGGERGALSTAGTRLALTQVAEPDLSLLAVVCGPTIRPWVLELPAADRPGTRAHLLGHPLLLTSPSAGGVPPDESWVISARFEGSAKAGLDLAVITSDGWLWRTRMLAPLPRGDMQCPASVAWRTCVGAALGRQLQDDHSRTQNIPDEDWSAACDKLRAAAE